MLKRDEILRPSCWNKAKDDEMVFVLLGRDAAAPAAIRAWMEKRVELGKNKPDDPQIVEAQQWIDKVEGEWTADDKAPTERGLRAIGFKTAPNTRFLITPYSTAGTAVAVTGFQVAEDLNWHVTDRHHHEDIPIVAPKTIGNVRRLCVELGIKL